MLRKNVFVVLTTVGAYLDRVTICFWFGYHLVFVSLASVEYMS